MKKLMKSVLACVLAFAMVLTVMPVNAYAANKKAVVVTNQKQLEKALKNGATNIVIKTNKSVKITIPASKKAAKATISVQAKNATITNKASVKAIEIKDAKAFVESGKNNDIKITDDKLSLTVAKSSKGSDIKIAKKDAEIKVVAKGDVASVTVAKTADVTLTVNKTATVASVNVAAKGASVDLNAKGTVSDVKVSEKAADTKLNINASGKVENVQIDAKADVAVAGSTTEAVKVTVNAKDTTIKAETAVDTTLNADTKLDLSKGAEGSTVTTKENVKADVANNTTDTVTVKDSTGNESTVDAGKTETKTDEGKKADDSNSGATNTNPGNISWGGSENDIGLDGVSGDGPDKTVEVGDEITLVPIFIPANATNKTVYWSISDSSVASVDDDGVVYAKKPGTAQVTVTTDQMGYKYTWNITVTEATLTGIDIEDNYDELYVGEQAYFNAQALPKAASLDGMTWKSRDPEVATIDLTTGKVEAKKIGKTVITAQKGEITSAALDLEVVAKPENSVKVTFHDGNDVYSITFVESNTKFSDVPLDENPAKAGFEFVGWATSPDSSDVIDNNFAIGTDCELYAVYKIKVCEVIFVQYYEEDNDVFEKNYGESITAPTSESDEGEEFLGWATSWNATKPEVKAGETITVTEDVTYYPVYTTKMIKITQSGNHVKYYTGALKDENGDNLEYDEDGTLTSQGNTGYWPYASGIVESLNFRVDDGYVITKITLDGVEHDITDSSEQGASFVQKAVEQGYVAVDRKIDHTIIIETKELNFTISKADESIEETVNGDGIVEYSVTGTAFCINDIVEVSVDADLQNYAPVISYEYCSMQDSLDNSEQINADEAVFTNEDDEGGYWLVRITLNLNGQTVEKLIRIWVIPPKKSVIDSVTQISRKEIKVLFNENLSREVEVSDLIISETSETNANKLDIETITKVEDAEYEYIIKLTQDMKDNTIYIVSAFGSSASFTSANSTVSKIE